MFLSLSFAVCSNVIFQLPLWMSLYAWLECDVISWINWCDWMHFRLYSIEKISFNSEKIYLSSKLAFKILIIFLPSPLLIACDAMWFSRSSVLKKNTKEHKKDFSVKLQSMKKRKRKITFFLFWNWHKETNWNRMCKEEWKTCRFDIEKRNNLWIVHKWITSSLLKNSVIVVVV